MTSQQVIAGQLEPVTRSVFEEQLARIRAEVRNPEAGVFGPDSWMWEITRHVMVFAGGIGRRITLQVAHPWVTSGVDQHSKVRSDSAGRARRTYRIVFAMIYGNLDMALEAAQLAHRVHANIEGTVDAGSNTIATGTHYMANEAHAMLWIHATMWDTFARVYQMFVRPLQPHELEAYYQETRRFAWLFGIPDAVLPQSWTAFQDYCNAMYDSGVLVVNPSTRQLTDFVMRPKSQVASRPMRWIRDMTIGMYPDNLRQAYGWEYDGQAFAKAVATGKRLQKWLPGRLRYIPSYYEALARLQGKRADALTRRMNKRIFHSEFLVS